MSSAPQRSRKQAEPTGDLRGDVLSEEAAVPELTGPQLNPNNAEDVDDEDEEAENFHGLGEDFQDDSDQVLQSYRIQHKYIITYCILLAKH